MPRILTLTVGLSFFSIHLCGQLEVVGRRRIEGAYFSNPELTDTPGFPQEVSDPL